MDPTFVRIAFVAATFAGGLGAAVYLAGWLLIPEADGTTVLNSRRADLDPWAIFGIGVLIFAVIFGTGLNNDDGIVLPLLLIAGGVFLLNQRRDGTPSSVAAGHAAPPLTTEPTTAAFEDHSLYPREDVTTPLQQPGPYWTPPQPPAQAPPFEPLETEPRPPAIVTRVALSLALFVIAVGVAIGASDATEYHATAISAGVLATFGLGLVVSAFIGRGRGLGLLAILALIATMATASLETAIDAGTGERDYRPASAAALDERYELGFGELVVDLRDVVPEPGERLEVEVDLRIGSAKVYVPRDVTIETEGDVSIGEVQVLGVFEAGMGNSVGQDRIGSDEAGTLVVDLHVGIGEGVIRYAN